MSKKKTNKIKIISTAKTGFYFIKKKSKKNIHNKILLKKYDPVIRKHVVFQESK